AFSRRSVSRKHASASAESSPINLTKPCPSILNAPYSEPCVFGGSRRRDAFLERIRSEHRCVLQAVVPASLLAHTSGPWIAKDDCLGVRPTAWAEDFSVQESASGTGPRLLRPQKTGIRRSQGRKLAAVRSERFRLTGEGRRDIIPPGTLM